MNDSELARENIELAHRTFNDTHAAAAAALAQAHAMLAIAESMTPLLHAVGQIVDRIPTVSTYAKSTDTTTDADVMLPETRGRYRDVDGDLWDRRGDGSVWLIHPRRDAVLTASDYVHNHGPYTPEPWVEVTDPAPSTLPERPGLYIDKDGDVWLIDTGNSSFACLHDHHVITEWKPRDAAVYCPFTPVYISRTPPTPEQADRADH